MTQREEFGLCFIALLGGCFPVQDSTHGGIIKEEMLCGVQYWCRYISTTPPLAWATWRWSTAYKTFNFDLLYFYSMPRTCSRPSKQALIAYSCLLTCIDEGNGSSVDHASGGVGGVMASLTTRYGERVLGQLLPNNTFMVRLYFTGRRIISNARSSSCTSTVQLVNIMRTAKVWCWGRKSLRIFSLRISTRKV